MYSYHGFEKRHKKPSLLLFFAVGIIGAIIGGLAMAVVLGGTGPGKENASHQPDRDRILLPEEYQYTGVVNAVEHVVDTVVGVSNYQRRGDQLITGATGSGVIIDSEGYVVTNQHVVDGADEVRVVFKDGNMLPAMIVGEDPLTDLAVLKISGDSNFKYASFSNSDRVRPGEVAIAIGNPLGLLFQHTVTVGVVSAKDRQIRVPGSEYRYTFIQTDAAINKGNSGGPLINLNGEIIGINSVKVIDPQVEGIGFAIPSNMVRRVAEDLVEHGRVARPRLGILIADLSEVTGVITDRGVYIHDVEPGTSADRAGLKDGDIIVELEDTRINYMAQLFDKLLYYYPGDKVEVVIIRDGSKLNFQIVLGEM